MAATTGPLPNSATGPAKTPAVFIQKAATDPASGWPGAAPSFGRDVMPHIFSVAGRVGTIGRTYPWFDEALRDSRENAEMMRTECGLMECLEARQRGTALLRWHIEPDDTESEAAKDLAAKVTDILQKTKDFLELRRNLLEALWYGRYLTSHRIGIRRIRGANRLYIRKWTPRHGDKIVFRYDDGTGEYNDDQIGLRMAGGYRWKTDTKDFMGRDRDKIEANTQFGLVYWLDEYERQRVAVHRHLIEDTEFHDVRGLGSVNGIGIRDRIYWTWYAMQQTLANALNFIERNAHGIEIWKYPAGNPQARAETEAAARDRSNKAVFLVPVRPGDMADTYSVEVIEPGFAGLDALMTLIKEYFAHKIKRYILGQTLTSEAEATGLGSGVADAHMATYADIVLFDSIKLAETITTDIVRPLQLWNFPGSEDVELIFKIDTETEDMGSKLEAWERVWNMGARLPESDVMAMIGARMPDEDDEVLQNPQFSGAMQDAMGQAAGMGDSPWQPNTTTTFGPMGNRNGNGQANGDGASLIDLKDSKPADRYALAHDVERAARQAAEPASDAQAEAGNYRLGHVRLHGMPISIECPKGRRRKPEWPPMGAHYGYVRRTEGKDGDHVDCFIGPNPESEVVYVIDQVDADGKFDEHKALLGFTNREDAIKAYRKSYTQGWKVGPVTSMTVGQFKEWLDSGDTFAPLEQQVSRYSSRWNRAIDNGKLSKRQARYRQCDGDACCNECLHFDGDQACAVVTGKIEPNDTCDYFEPDSPSRYARKKSGEKAPFSMRRNNLAAIERYARKKKLKDSPGQQRFKWITIGGSPGPGGDHEDGTPVQIDTEQTDRKPIVEFLKDSINSRGQFVDEEGNERGGDWFNQQLADYSDEEKKEGIDWLREHGTPAQQRWQLGAFPRDLRYPKEDKQDEFLTAGEAVKQGKSHAEWTGPISDAYVNEDIDEDHPAWQAISNQSTPIRQYAEASAVYGEHVKSIHDNSIGKVTDVSDDASTVTVTHPDGSTSTHDPQTLSHLGAHLDERLRRGGGAPRDVEYMAKELAKEAVENEENISETMRRHGIDPVKGMSFRKQLAGEASKLREKPGAPPSSRLPVSPAQSKREGRRREKAKRSKHAARFEQAFIKHIHPAP